MTEWTHIPVLAREIGDLLITDKNGLYVDGTLGLGGHTKYLLSLLGAGARVVGLDKDINAIKMARENAADPRLSAVNKSYEALPDVLKELGLGAADGILLDLGLSSYQLDDAARGFSFMRTGPLDMRFDINGALSAQQAVNTYSVEELVKIFVDYGEEAALNAQKAAMAIFKARREKAIDTTGELAAVIESVLPRRGKTHPATRIFQALRIEVNDELGTVTRAARALPLTLKPGGRLAVITFHSLEDRIVKNIFKELASEGVIKLVNKKVIEPKWEEVKQNPRARSAKLRVVEKL